MQVTDMRPPYVRFILRDVEDRAASLAAGHYVGKDVPFALITPAGSRDVIERDAEEWFVNLDAQVREQRYPGSWVAAFKEAYRAWKNDEEPPVNGTALRNWPGVSPAQYKTLRDLRILTVEDLASINEEAIQRIGMGARALKENAAKWLETAKDSAPLQQLQAANLRISEQDAQIASMAEKMNQMAAALQAAGMLNPAAQVPVETEKTTLAL